MQVHERCERVGFGRCGRSITAQELRQPDRLAAQLDSNSGPAGGAMVALVEQEIENQEDVIDPLSDLFAR